MKDLDIQLDPETARKDKALQLLLGHPLDQLLRKPKPAPSEKEIVDFPPADVAKNSPGSA